MKNIHSREAFAEWASANKGKAIIRSLQIGLTGRDQQELLIKNPVRIYASLGTVVILDTGGSNNHLSILKDEIKEIAAYGKTICIQYKNRSWINIHT